VCCGVLQCVAVCCSVSLIAPQFLGAFATVDKGSELQYVAVCCSVLQCVAVCCGETEEMRRTLRGK